jgi:hypothetical protein
MKWVVTVTESIMQETSYQTYLQSAAVVDNASYHSRMKGTAAEKVPVKKKENV